MHSFLAPFDSAWRWAGQRPLAIGFTLAAVGIVFLLWSMAAGLDFVTFHGVVLARGDEAPVLTALQEIEVGLSKEVGFFLAPNWGLAAVALIPLIGYRLCKARGALDDLPERMVSQRMLRAKGGGPANLQAVRAHFDAHGQKWTLAFPTALLLLFIVVMIFDFGPVVGKWLIGSGVSGEELRQIPLNHETYEFDWSVAALFPAPNTGRFMNFAFSLAAYLWIGFLCPGLIFGAFVWFAAYPQNLDRKALESIDHELVPEIDAADARLGFDAFEDFFGHLLWAALLTAVLALGMHLQNVFLRAPDVSGLHDMVFGAFREATDGVAPNGEATGGEAPDEGNPFFIFATLLTDLQSVGKTLDVNFRNMQFLATGIALLLLAIFPLGMVAGALHQAARHGRMVLRRELASRRDAILRLRQMKTWPLDSVVLSRTFVSFYILLILLSMWWVNFLGVILFGLIFLAVPAVLWVVGTWVARRWQGGEEDGPSPYERDPGSDNSGTLPDEGTGRPVEAKNVASS